MKNYKKIISLTIGIVTIAIILITLILINNKKETPPKEEIKTLNINQVEDVKTVYNLGKMITNSAENIFIHLYHEQDYYIQKAYNVNISDTITVYFLDGYFINEEIAEEADIVKNEVAFTIVINDNIELCIIERYGKSYKEVFEYNNDISKTRVKESTQKNIDEYFTGTIEFSKEILYEDVSDLDLIYWYFNDYKNKKLFNNNNIDEYKKTTFSVFSGTYEEGYTLLDNEEKEILIKPRNMPMEYEVTFE